MPMVTERPARKGDALRFARWSALTYIVTVPLTSHFAVAFAPHDFSRLTQFAVLLLCAGCCVVRSTDHKCAANASPLALAGGSILALAFASTLMAPDIEHAFRELSLVLGLIGIVFVVAAAEFKAEIQPLLGVAAGGAATYSVLVLAIATVVTVSGATIARAELFFGYDNYRFFNHVQTVCLPLLAIATTLDSGKRTTASIAWIGLVTGLALLMISGARATSLGLLVGVAAAFMVSRKDARRLATHVFAALLVAGPIYTALLLVPSVFNGASLPGDSIAGTSSDALSNGRAYLWRLAFQYIEESPWLGIGPMHYAHYANTKAAHPHNVYLQLAAEWGIPVLLSCLVLTLWGLHRLSSAIKSCADQEQRMVGIGLLTACVAVMVDGVFSGNFVMPMAQMWIAIVVGASIAWTRSHRLSRARQEPASSARHWVLVASTALLVSQVWLVWSVLPEASQLSKHLEHVSKDLSQSPRATPRLWSDGWF